ncbi:MAG: ribosome maturation factor RimP [Firmicutes bacterium]|nr:ribosome maturation factor RimP [Bacillota bacterium]
MGLSLIEVRLAREGPRWVLRVVIYRPEGVGLEDCEKVSERLSPVLDEADLIETSYSLEVSSPGLERVFRRLEEYEVFKGHRVYVSTYAPVERAGREIRGALGGLVRDGANGVDSVRVVLDDGEEVVIPLKNVAKARLDEVDFLPAAKRGGRRRER